MTDSTKPVPILIAASEIAEIASVGSSAVSNWKRRHSDFPAEIEEGLYDRKEVLLWLRDAGKDITLPAPEPIESMLWRWANEFRGVLRIDEMPEVLLQLITLRAAASRRYERLLPIANFWDELLTSGNEDFAFVLRRVTEEVGASDPDLARALRPPGSSRRLETSDWRQLLHVLDQMHPDRTDWGLAATALVTGFVQRYGAKGGEHSSGAGLVDLMSALLEPLQGNVYDPACGAAVFLSSAWQHHSDSIELLYGQEVNEQSWRLGFLHLLLHDAPFELVTGDTLMDDRLWQMRADRIALEPPIGQHLRSRDRMDNDPRWAWGFPPKSSADLAWVQHVAFHLAEDGIGVVAVSPGALTRGRSEALIRMQLIEADLLDAVVLLPPGMLAATSIPVALLVLQKGRPNRSRQVLFVDAQRLGTPERGGLRRMDSREIARIADAVRGWRDGSTATDLQFSAIATSEDVLAHEGVLAPNRYVSYAEAATEINGEPIAMRYERLVGELDEPVEGMREIAANVRQELSSIDVPDERPEFSSVRLGELVMIEPQSGMRQQKDGEGEGVPWVSTRAVSGGAAVLDELPSDVTFGNVKGRLVEDGDLLLVSRGVERLDSVPCATVRFSEPAAFSGSLIRLRVDQSRVVPDYLRLYLSSRQGSAALAAAATGSVISNLRRAALQEVEIHLPDLQTQRIVVASTTRIEEQLLELQIVEELLRDLYDTAREGLTAGILETRGITRAGDPE